MDLGGKGKQMIMHRVFMILQYIYRIPHCILARKLISPILPIISWVPNKNILNYLQVKISHMHQPVLARGSINWHNY